MFVKIVSFVFSFGCSKRDIPASKFELHETHCQRHMTVCEECEEVVPKQRLEEHKTEFHAPIPCDLCGVTVAKHDLEDHKVGGTLVVFVCAFIQFCILRLFFFLIGQYLS